MKESPVKNGARFGKLTVTKALPLTKNEHGHIKWECLCDCGEKVCVWGFQLAKKTGNRVACHKRECRREALAALTK